MNKWMSILIFMVFLPITGHAYEGDYVWEDKFVKALPKANDGDPEAQYKVGVMYEKGRGTDKDLAKAFEWYVKAAEQGQFKAAHKLGFSYLRGRGVEQNSELAYKWFKIAADKGYERAQYYLGEMYEHGSGVAQNYDHAIEWYQKAAAGGYQPASEGVTRVIAAKEESDRQKESVERRRTEAAARAKLSDNGPAKAQKVSMKASPPTTKELLMKGGWKKRKAPVEFLPSEIAQCTDTGRAIECMSDELTRNIGVADISYRTKAVLYSIKDSGSFKISYRNNVTDVEITDPQFEKKGGPPPVSLGWQDGKHSLDCEIKDDNQLICKKDKVRSVTFER